MKTCGFVASKHGIGCLSPPPLPYTMRKTLAFLALALALLACERSYYHDAEVLAAYQRQAKAACLGAAQKDKLTTCRRAKACQEPAQRGLEAIKAYQLASASMTATSADRVAADAAYAGAVAACGVAGIRLAGVSDAGLTHDASMLHDASSPIHPHDGGTHD